MRDGTRARRERADEISLVTNVGEPPMVADFSRGEAQLFDALEHARACLLANDFAEPRGQPPDLVGKPLFHVASERAKRPRPPDART